MKTPTLPTLFLSALILSSTAVAAPVQGLRLIETSPELAREALARFPNDVRAVSANVVLMPADRVADLSRLAHGLSGHCGGFMDVTGEPTGQARKAQIESLLGDDQREPLPDLGSRKEWVSQMLDEVRAPNLRDFDLLYTGQFQTRLASSEQGEAAPRWLQQSWQNMANGAGRSDIKVELVDGPDGYAQKSVRITIPGKNPDAAIVVMGAHLDSINRYGDDTAPGQDDDASGISALTEAYRIILAHNAHPDRTIQIFGYAAEELGLLGSRVIAQQYQESGAKVRGVLQLDMVAYPGQEHAVTFMTDYVDRDLTTWTEQLYGLYVGGDVKEDRCGYGCSDHASWTRYGFPSVMPFETSMHGMNPRIHSSNDVWDELLDVEHAARFTKLAVAFAAEMSGQ